MYLFKVVKINNSDLTLLILCKFMPFATILIGWSHLTLIKWIISKISICESFFDFEMIKILFIHLFEEIFIIEEYAVQCDLMIFGSFLSRNK